METDLKKKIGELVMVGFEGTTITPKIKKLITEFYVGNVILFARNIINPLQLKKLCQDLQALRKKVSATPLLIAVDQEGGAVTRVFKKGLIFPGNMSLGSINSKTYAYRVGKALALELTALGINVNLAPVLDINTNPHNPGIGIRSLSDNPQIVTELGQAILSGMQNHGLSACAKHFPGKGEASLDAHLNLPAISSSLKALHKKELKPFKTAINNNSHLILVSHVMYPKIDKKYPASLSKEIILNLLKKKMKYKGVVVTDDLEMKAIVKNIGVKKAALLALKHGVDIILICHTYQKQLEAITNLYKAVERGTIQKKDIEEKLSRSYKLRQLYTKKYPGKKFSSKKHSLLAESIAKKSITIVKNQEHLIPISDIRHKTIATIIPLISNLTLVEEGNTANDYFYLAMKKHAKHTINIDVDSKPTTHNITAVIKRLKKSNLDMIIALTYNAHLIKNQAILINKILSLKIPTIIAAIRNPYDILAFPQAKNYVVSYSFRNISLEALTLVILGKIKAKGRLPVKLPKQTS